MRNRRILLTGATGFVGSRLYPALIAAGYDVMCATRDPECARRAHPERMYCLFDTARPDTLAAPLHGCAGSFYLIHGMAEGGNYVERERLGASAFRAAAESAGTGRVVYLGGMRPRGRPSRHLRSRLETGEILRASRVPCLELQASMIIGAGSESFRIVRDLSARLPAMVLPAWSNSSMQPVGVSDVVAALVHAMAHRELRGAFALPGPETLSAREILLRTAHLLGRAPRMVGVPLVTPKLSAYWIRLITRADHNIASELVQGLRSDIVHDGLGYWEKLPGYRRQSFDVAARGALEGESLDLANTTLLVERLIDQLSPREHHGGP
jgi:uncharacterized protein YbjT (DUF2867 family)